MTRLGIAIPGGVRVLNADERDFICRSPSNSSIFSGQQPDFPRPSRSSKPTPLRALPPEDAIEIRSKYADNNTVIGTNTNSNTNQPFNPVLVSRNVVPSSSKSVRRSTRLSTIPSGNSSLSPSKVEPLSDSASECIKLGLTPHPAQRQILPTSFSKPKPSSTVLTITPTQTVSRRRELPVRTFRQPFWLVGTDKENFSVPASVTSRSQVTEKDLNSSLKRRLEQFEGKEPHSKRRRVKLGQAVNSTRNQQQIKNQKTRAQAKGDHTASGIAVVSNKQSEEPIGREPMLRLSIQQYLPDNDEWQPLQTPTESFDTSQESSNTNSVLPTLPPSEIPVHTLPESSSRKRTRKTLSRSHKRAHSEISTGNSDIVQTPEPSGEALSTPLRPKAFAAVTRPALESPYARKYAPKKHERVTESMLPKFTMPVTTFDADTIVLQYKKRLRARSQSPSNGEEEEGRRNEWRISTGTGARIGSPGTQKKSSRARHKKRNSGSRTGENADSALQYVKPPRRTTVPEVSLLPNDPEIEASDFMDEDLQFSDGEDRKIPERPLREEYPEPYSSTFFFPHLDDYDLPFSARVPPLYYHTENPSHPPVPDRSMSTPASLVSGMSEMNLQRTMSSSEELRSLEIAKLLEPISEEEDNNNESMSDDESACESWHAGNSIVRFPRDATAETATEYGALKRALKMGLAQQKDVEEKLEAATQNQQKLLKAQEEFEKKERWAERTTPGRIMGTKSRGGGMADYPDFLEYLRGNARGE